jgi:hypothetical protein
LPANGWHGTDNALRLLRTVLTWPLFTRPRFGRVILTPFCSAFAIQNSGSDNTIFPKSVADYLGITLKKAAGPAASVFGGSRVQLLEGRTTLRIESGIEWAEWKTVVCFFDFASGEEETVILGHAGFLDYFTATFDGKRGVLSLLPNDDLPILAATLRRKRRGR